LPDALVANGDVFAPQFPGLDAHQINQLLNDAADQLTVSPADHHMTSAGIVFVEEDELFDKVATVLMAKTVQKVRAEGMALVVGHLNRLMPGDAIEGDAAIGGEHVAEMGFHGGMGDVTGGAVLPGNVEEEVGAVRQVNGGADAALQAASRSVRQIFGV